VADEKKLAPGRRGGATEEADVMQVLGVFCDHVSIGIHRTG
jgi:hypothetical protein